MVDTVNQMIQYTKLKEAEPKLCLSILSVIHNIVLMHPSDPDSGHLNMHPVPGFLAVHLEPVPNAKLPENSTARRLTHTDSAPCAGGRPRGIPSRWASG